MKPRPRSVENAVADHLSQTFHTWGLPPIERIPVLGRTGPDLTTNALSLVIDVKSRLSVPKSIFLPLLVAFTFDGFLATRLSTLHLLFEQDAPAPLDFHSTTIRQWWEHMEAWTRRELPQGISALVLHRPKLPTGDAVIVIHSQDRRRLHDHYHQHADCPVPDQ